MYKFESSHLMKTMGGLGYKNYDLSNMLLGDILTDFIDGYIELSNTSLTTNIFVDINQLKQDTIPINEGLKFNVWLNNLGGFAINGATSKPSYSKSVVTCRDVNMTNFIMDICPPNGDINHKSVASYKTYQKLVTPYSDPSLVDDQILVTVNGFLHRSYKRGDGYQIVDGGKTANHAKYNNRSVLSFNEIGKLTQYPITKDNLSKYTSTSSYSESCVVDLDHNIDGKSIILSLIGYMFVNPDFVKILDATRGLIQINMQQVDMARMILSAYQILDLSDLNVVDDSKGDPEFGGMLIQRVNSDEVTMKFLTAPQSFVTVVDAPFLRAEYEPLCRTGVYGYFECHEEPKYPIMDLNGRLSECIYFRHVNDKWGLYVYDPTYRDYILNVSSNHGVNGAINKIIPNHIRYLEEMHVVKIISERKI